MRLLLLSIRSLRRYRLYSFINVIGLALSLACTILISRYVYSELSVDRFIDRLDQLYMVTFHTSTVSEPRYAGITADQPEATRLLNDAAIDKVSSFCLSTHTIVKDETAFELNVLAVDDVFLDLFDYPLLSGDRNTLFDNPSDLVITRSYARKLFGKENPIGEKLFFAQGKEGEIKGIIKDPVTKSSLSFDVLVSAQSEYNPFIGRTVVRLHPNTDIRVLNERWNVPVADTGIENETETYQLFPYRKIYFDETIVKLRIFSQGNRKNVNILLFVALLIFLVGLFNYINIYTLIQQKRKRELGLKKVFGSGLRHVISQLFVENIILIGSALFLAWVLIELGGGLIESHLGLDFVVRPSFDFALSLSILLGLPVIVSLYPFIRYLYSPSITSLRNTFAGNHPGAGRQVFLVGQYVITLSIIIVTLFFVKQLHYMLHADRGYLSREVIKASFVENIPNRNRLTRDERAQAKERQERNYEAIARRMDQSTLFDKWAFRTTPNGLGRIKHNFRAENGGTYQMMVYTYADNAYFSFFDFHFTAGHPWDESEVATVPLPIIINESAQKKFGMTDLRSTFILPENLMLPVGGDLKQSPAMQVIGVVKDFHTEHLSKAPTPVIFLYADNKIVFQNAPLVASIVPGRRPEAIKFLQELHQELVGGDFTYTFLEDEIAKVYEGDKKIVLIYSVFVFIAIFISSMGLFGLSMFDMQQRYKEIAIRKVNGATAHTILNMLLRKYYKLLLIAFLIAVPLTWLGLTKYLEDFAHRTSISWWLFAVALIITAGIALLTLIWQVRKAASANPADAIKTE